MIDAHDIMGRRGIESPWRKQHTAPAHSRTGRSNERDAAVGAAVHTNHQAGFDVRWLLEVLTLAALYFLTARLGLLLAMPGGHITPVWPPSGIALAAVLLRGGRVWPGIWLGSFAANIWGFYGSPISLVTELATSATFGIGATCTALLGRQLLRGFVGERNPLERVRDVCAFMALGGLVSCLFSATLGVTTYCLAGFAPWSAYGQAWLTWWLGDTAGVFIVAPLLLVWGGFGLRMRAERWVELFGGFGLLIAVTHYVFIESATVLPLAFILIPFLVWVAVRFGRGGAAVAAGLIALLAVWGTIHGSGPFNLGSRNESLLALELFLSVVSLTALCLAVMVAERREAESSQRHVLNELESRVTERTASLDQVNAALRESEARTRLLIKSSNIGLWDWNLVSNDVFFSPEWKSQLGYADDEVPGRYEEWEKRLHPEDRERALRAVRDFREGRRDNYDVEFRLRHKDGTWRSILTRADLLRDATGQAVRMLGCHIDITARKQAEEAFAEQAIRYKTLMETSTDSIYLVNEKGDLQEANAAFLRERGYSAAELKGLNVADWDAQWSRAQLQERMRKLVGSSAVFETRHRCKDGAVFDVEVCATSVRIGGEQLFFCVTRDVTGRKQAEQALRESEERFRELAENIDNAVWLSDPQHKEVLYISPAYEKIWGRTCESLRASVRSWTEALHPEDRERILALRADNHLHEMPEMTFRIVRPDGSIRWIHSREFPVKDADGKVVRVAGVVEDITDRTQAEEKLRRSEEKFKVLFGIAPVGISVLDRQHNIVDANPALEQITRLPKEELLNGAYRHRAYLNADGTPKSPSELPSTRAITENRRINNVETGIVTESGEIIWTQVSVAPLALPDASAVVITQDITERKRVELALAERLRFETLLTELSAAFANLPSTAVDREIDKWLQNLVEFLDVDRAIFDQVGEDGITLSRSHSHTTQGIDTHPLNVANDQTPWITKQLLQGETVKWTRIPEEVPEQASKEREFVDRIGAKSVLSIPVCIGGSVICALSFTSMRIYRDWPDEMVARLRLVGEVFANAVARKRAEGTLFRREAELNEAQRLASIGSWEWDFLADVLTYSDELRSIFGFEGEDLSSPDKAFLEAVHPDDRGRRSAAIKAALNGGPPYNVEFRIIRPDKSIRFVHSRGQLTYGEGGKPVRLFGMTQDITEAKRAAKDLEDANHRLRLLSRRQGQLQEDERRRLSRELHDQIGQALMASKVNVESALQSTPGEPTRQALLETIALVDQMLQQVRDISFDLRPPVLDDLGLAPALRWTLHRYAQRAGLITEFFADPTLPRTDVEIETACFRIALEAITNVVRHAQARKIGLELRQSPDALHLLVRDDGVGFNGTKAAKPAGRLGLAGMRERAFLVGGTFEYKSTPGGGTKVHASFPISSSAPSEE